MNIVKWDPFRSLFDFPSPSARGVAPARSWTPAVDIYEKDDTLILRAELPGVAKEDIDVTVEDGVLTLRGERKHEKDFEDATSYRRERWYGSFTRSFVLPETLDASRVAAKYDNGILQVTLPKAEAAKPRKIAIQAA